VRILSRKTSLAMREIAFFGLCRLKEKKTARI
jgi:hypothetical protein